MRIRVSQESNSTGWSITGEVLHWSHTVESFENVYMSVPAVVVKEDDGRIWVLALKKYCYQTTVEEVQEGER